MSGGKLNLRPTLYTIPAGIPFAAALADGIIGRYGENPETLTRLRVLLPTRRACRTLRDAFLQRSGGKPLLLPQMQTIGDADQEELSLGAVTEEQAAALLALKPPLPLLRRQILLARTVMKMPDYNARPDQAVALASALGRLMDQVYTEGLDLADLADLAPAEFADHWQITLDFLRIISENWPKILAAEGMVDAADHRTRLVNILCGQWETCPPAFPVVAAGSTGSIPSTARLLKTVAHLPEGCVVLPGLDQLMDEESWQAQDASHPQARLKQLLGRIGASRQDVKLWPGAISATHRGQPPQLVESKQAMRRWLASEIMRPAETAEAWTNLAGQLSERQHADLGESLKDLRRFDCDTPREEAVLIALLMREALEEDGCTAMLVTPDRNLARRVAMACRRWHIEVDDSGGQKLGDTPAGSFLRLSLRACLRALAPAALCALLKHRLCSAGYEHAALGVLVQTLEEEILRGPAPGPGISGLQKRLATERERRPEHAKPYDSLAGFLQALETSLAPFFDLCTGDESRHSFMSLLDAHITMAQNLAAGPGDETGLRLWTGEDGEAAALFLAELREHGRLLPDVTAAQYEEIVSRLMTGVTVRPAYGSHPRLFILGQLEARLMQADLVILGGLNEGTWPPDPGHDPWMSRPMRKKFGLPEAEHGIGLAAHDFIEGFCAPRVVMTRSRRADGTLQVPARWLQRLDTVLNALDIDPKSLQQSVYYPYYARKIDDPGEPPRPYGRARFAPPRDKRPRSLSVTRIETWMRDPYSIYAYKVLRLSKLKPLEEDADAAIRGTLVHEVLDGFISAHKDSLPDNALEIVTEQGRSRLAEEYEGNQSLDYWWPRFERLARWFIDNERDWRKKARPLLLETSGSTVIRAPGGDFTLSAKADRIDLMLDGSLALIDYKTGAPPGNGDIIAGFSPQLPLEGVIAAAGGFGAEAARPVSYLGFWRLSGGAAPGEEKPVTMNGGSLQDLIESAREGLMALIDAFDDEDQPYLSLPSPDKAPRKEWQDYAHLARVAEWADLDESTEAA